MRSITWLVMVAFVFVGACAPTTPEQQIINDAALALGGAAAIEAAASVTAHGEGSMGNLGQDMTPEATSQRFTISDYEIHVELASGRFRVSRTRTPQFNYFRGPDPIPEVFGLDGDVGYTVAPDGTARRSPNAAARDLRIGYYQHPLTLLHAALKPGASLSNARTENGESFVNVTTPDGTELTLVTGDSGLPVRISAMMNHTNLRDVVQTTTFADYEEVDGLMLPTAFTRLLDDYELLEMTMSSQSVGGDVSDLSAPDAASSADPVTGPPPANVEAEEVADGVWFLAGQSHHSVLVELSDHTMLIEAPNEVRTLAVIERARELVPDKPLTHLVNSHHHFDHSGGVRAAISEGLTIVTHVANAAFVEDLAARPSTLDPDALERNQQDLQLETVDDHMTHGDDSMSVELYHIAGNTHGSALLMAYIPKHRILVEADAFSPGRAFQPFAPSLLEELERRDLRIDRIVPIHGGVTTYDDLVTTAQAN